MNGSIRRRSKNSWELTIDLGRDASGRRRRKFVAVKGKRSDADRILREMLAAADRGAPLDTSKLTVAEYLERWHRDYAVVNTRQRTADRYQDDIRNHLTPHLGHLLFSKVVPADIQRMEASLLSEGLSPRSVEHAHRVLSLALKHAVRWGLTWRNPCDSVSPPRKTRKEVEILEVSLVLRLLDMAKDTGHFAAFHFLTYTGARRGEACGLMWRDVDLERGKVFIRQAATKPRGQGVTMAPPKTDKGRRNVTIDPETVEVLRAHRGAQMVQETEFDGLYENQGYVFAGPQGAPLNPDALTYAWHQLALKAGAKSVRLHDLRHFHASMLMKVEINPKVVQERLGHSVIGITMDTYSHLVPAAGEGRHGVRRCDAAEGAGGRHLRKMSAKRGRSGNRGSQGRPAVVGALS